jgi:hypothetical protein
MGTTSFAKAKFIELDSNFRPKNGGKTVEVQFNPETLKVSYSNQVTPPTGGGAGAPGDRSNQASRQVVGAGTTKLALTLWFDVSALGPNDRHEVDVRELTKEVAYFITPIAQGTAYAPPVFQFLWGSFHFDGMMDSLEESLEFFSEDGLPLRASMAIAMSQQKIQEFSGQAAGPAGATPPGASRSPSGGAPGATPQVQAPAGASLQGLAGQAGVSASWQAIADANGIDNPRQLQPGQLIDLNLPQMGGSG